MSHWRRYAALGAVAYLAWLLALLPAALVAHPLARALPELTLHAVSGTVWSGHAASLELAGYGLQSLRWSWRPDALWRGRLELQLSLADARVQARARAGLRLPGGGYYVQDLRASLPAALVGGAARIEPVQLGGTVVADVAELELQGERVRAAVGQLQWRDARLRAPEAQPLGGYAVRLQAGPKGELEGSVRDLGGPLLARGQVSVTFAGHYRVNLRLTAKSAADGSLRQGLALIGAPGPDGSVRVALSGQLD